MLRVEDRKRNGAVRQRAQKRERVALLCNVVALLCNVVTLLCNVGGCLVEHG